jgi:lipopolysaccharide/colanic/teichoic acid biosynthesis glycosyltransferase
MRTNREGPPQVFLIGAPDDLETAMTHLRTDPTRALVVAASSDTDRLVDRVDESGATDVVLLSSMWLDSLYPRALQEFDERGVSVLQRVTAKETMFGLERVRQIGGLPFVLLRPHAIAASREHFKRFTDLVFLVVLAPFFVPLLTAVAMYQFFVVGRPILFWQERVGARGRPFRMVKFRTMYANAEEDGNPRLASQDDPRIIPACKWLRATRLDELPQIFNVLRGEMSLVGPRPERPELTAQFERVIPGYARRHELPPGLTGLAQIHGRYHTDPEYKLGYDLQYLVNWSPVLDLEIIARTVWVVLTRKI